MFEKSKVFIKENPETVKKIGMIGGAVLGAAVVGTILYLNRETMLPLNVELVELDPPVTE